MIYYSADSDFASILLLASNAVEKRGLEVRVLKGQGLPVKGFNNKVEQLNHAHRALHHRPHQAEY